MSHSAPPRRPGARPVKLRTPKRVSLASSHSSTAWHWTLTSAATPQPGLEVPIEDMWKRLSNAIAQIQNHNISALSYEEHYRYAYNLVLVSVTVALRHSLSVSVLAD